MAFQSKPCENAGIKKVELFSAARFAYRAKRDAKEKSIRDMLFPQSSDFSEVNGRLVREIQAQIEFRDGLTVDELKRIVAILQQKFENGTT